MERLHYVDNLRVACMLLGLYVHVTTLGRFPVVGLVPDLSELFRMATFFLLAGYFAAMVLKRRGRATFLRDRALAVGLPLVVGLVVLNPATLWAIYAFHNGATDPGFGAETVWRATFDLIPHRGTMVWHLHLWFLISLLVYVLVTPLLAAAAGRVGDGLADWMTAPARRRLVPLMLAAGVAVASVAALVVLHVSGLNDVWLVRATLRYLPFFALGVLVFLQPRLWAEVQRLDVPLWAFCGVLVVGTALAPPLPDLVARILEVVELAALRCAIAFGLLGLFRRFVNGTGGLARGLSDAIYTIYLFHYLLIYLLGHVWASVGPLGPVDAVVIATLSGVLGYGLHLGVIKRFRTMTLLFNGKRTAPALPVRGPVA